MMSISGDVIFTFPAGKLKQDVTSVTLVDNTAKTIDTEISTGKRAIFLFSRMNNPDSVARTVKLLLYKEAAATNLLLRFTSDAVSAGGYTQVPNSAGSTTDMRSLHQPMHLNAGNILRVTWNAGGVSAGGTDADGLVLEYIEVDEP